MIKGILVYCSLLTICRATPIAPLYDDHHHEAVDYHAYPKYQFAYDIKDEHTGDVKSQHEERDGGIVKGTYSLIEPDGSKRTVEYTADDHNGFNAVVLKDAGFHPAPAYKTPILAHPLPAYKAEPILLHTPSPYKAYPAPSYY